MTKKDYIVIASAIKQSWAELQDKQEHLTTPSDWKTGLATLQHKLAHALRNENERFDINKFFNFIDGIK